MPIALKIVTPAAVAYEGEAAEVQVPGWLGEYGVLPQHAAMLTLTRPGVLTIHSNSGTNKLLIGKGLAEVGAESVTLLVDLCEAVTDIDKDAAKRDLAHAETEQKQVAAGSAEHTVLQNRIDLAKARIHA